MMTIFYLFLMINGILFYCEAIFNDKKCCLSVQQVVTKFSRDE